MEHDSHPGTSSAPASAERRLSPLFSDFRAAIATSDLASACAMITDAAALGTPAGRLYVEVIRPALAELEESAPTPQARLAVGIGETIMSELIGRLALSERVGSGRAAVVSGRRGGIESLDGTVAMGFLQSDGWIVDRLSSDEPWAQADDAAGALTELLDGGGIELAVAVTAGPHDVLRLAPPCNDLLRLADPPVIVLCDFTGRSEHRAASRSLGIQVVAHDPEELLDAAGQHLPAPGGRRWGVRLSRSGDTLELTPTGRLDAVSVERLRDVVLTRAGSFTRLVLDLADVATVEPEGLAQLSRWTELEALAGVSLALRPRPEAAPGFQPEAAGPCWQVV